MAIQRLSQHRKDSVVLSDTDSTSRGYIGR